MRQEPSLEMPSGDPAHDLRNAPTKGYYLASVSWLLRGIALLAGILAAAWHFEPQLGGHVEVILWVTALVCAGVALHFGIQAHFTRREERDEAARETDTMRTRDAEQVEKAMARLAEERGPVEGWLQAKGEDEALTSDDVSVRDLLMEFTETTVKVSMDVVNRAKESITVAGVCVEWVRTGANQHPLPNAVCVLASERADIKDYSQVTKVFELSRDLADHDVRSADTWVSFTFTRNRIRWKHWGKAVPATLRV